MKPRFVQSVARCALGALSMGVLVACGGGDGGGGIGVADGGIRGTGSSVGPVSGFGSVIVNRTTFNTEEIVNAEVQSNDGIECERHCENRLRKGMIVRVDGKWRQDGTGTAESIEYDDTFRGVVTDVDVIEQTTGGRPASGTFRILEQTITFDRRTVIRLGTEFESASDFEGRLVRVSAWKNGDNYRSSFVGEIAPVADGWLELEGPASHYDPDTRSFRIGTQVITYGVDEVFRDGLDASYLEEDNVFVEVEGPETGGVVSARTIRRSDNRRFRGQEDEDIEISGPVEDYSAASPQFFINGVTVVITDETDFDDFDRARLIDGLLVEVEGDFLNGVVVAEEIELLEGDAEVSALVTRQGHLNNSWIVGGVTVVLSDFTLIDKDDEQTGPISTGLFLEVEGIERETEDGLIYIDALNVEVEDAGDDEFELIGRLRPGGLTPVVAPIQLDILGLTMAVPQGAIKDEEETGIYECDHLEVDYTQLVSGTYEAIEIECED